MVLPLSAARSRPSTRRFRRRRAGDTLVRLAADKEIGSAETLIAGEAMSVGADAIDRSPSLVAGRYEVLGLLGVGGMGRVYRARDRSLDEIVALKVLRAELVAAKGMLERFRSEVKLARRVTSPNVVRTFDLGAHEGEMFLTMEYVEGRALADLLEERGALPPAEARHIALEICAGVAAAHAAGVLHRDLKPDNVIVAANGRVVITDFGIARVATGAGATLDGLVGTPAYMAPEQARATRELTPATDVYALGGVLYEMLTGTRAWPGSDPIAVAMARLLHPPPDPRAICAVPTALAEIVLRCLAVEPADRFAGADALAAALAAADVTPATLRPPAAPRPYAFDLPATTACSVALLPFECAAPEMREVAEGLTEEIVDALSMTRGLRVRPLASVRTAAAAEPDPREIGARLGVDVVVNGSLRPTNDGALRVTARAIGVADGFQLWATRRETSTALLVSLGDELARAIAHALTADLDPAPRAETPDARATELYLQGKHKLRKNWHGDIGALPLLEEAARLSPESANILAACAMALARASFFGGSQEHLARARDLATRATERGPGLGEAWLALGVACLYDRAATDAAFALTRAIARAPGLAMAHALLGGILLEVGPLEDALAHLDAARALDPDDPQAAWEAARAHAFAGRDAESAAALNTISTDLPMWRVTRAVSVARFAIWKGTTIDLENPPVEGVPLPIAHLSKAYLRIARTGTVDEEARRELALASGVDNPRFKSALCQFKVELFAFAGDATTAMASLREAVDADLLDRRWLEDCPLLAPFRGQAEFEELLRTVASRADRVLGAIRAARAPKLGA